MKHPVLNTAVCLLFIVTIATQIACKGNEQKTSSEDMLIASVYNKHLYKSELDGMVPEEATKEDSALITNAFIENWIRESLIMHEAERNIPKDLNIDDLVRDYRASLIRHNYEKTLVELQLDSTINISEITDFYNESKEQFKLDEPIIRCRFMAIPKDSPELDKVDKWWKEKNLPDELVAYASSYATQFILSDSTWYKQSIVKNKLPEGNRKAAYFKSGATSTFDGEDLKYYIRVLGRRSKNKIAPMSFAKNQIIRVILHKRKIALLDEKREEIYEREINKNTIKVYN